MTDREFAESFAGKTVPDLSLSATGGTEINFALLRGVTVVYAYPRTSPPHEPPMEGWDKIPGARGCTPQSKGFAEHHRSILTAGASNVFGLSTQGTDYQEEMVQRLSLPFAILSDSDLKFANAMKLPRFEAGGMTLLTRITLILKDGAVLKVLYPVENPADNGAEVVAYLSR